MKHLKELIIEENPENMPEIIDNYLSISKDYLTSLPQGQARRECISGLNRYQRQHQISSLQFNLKISVGDIVYCDFGHSYLNESGFQHFGLVVVLFSYKAFIVPMSSNDKAILNARNYKQGSQQKAHLYFIGQPKGMNRPSVLFLNDGKFINTARIIDVKSSLSVQGRHFKAILNIYEQLFKGK